MCVCVCLREREIHEFPVPLFKSLIVYNHFDYIFSSLIDLPLAHICCPYKVGVETNTVSAVPLVTVCYIFGILF